MSNAEAKFRIKLKEMMNTLPIEDINVTTLCKECKCHRQTFYYHYTDVFDLLTTIFLNENVPGLTEARDIESALNALLIYTINNFEWLRSVNNSAASDLVDGFFFNKIVNNTYNILSKNNNYSLTKVHYRTISRRYAKLLAAEFSFHLKDANITVQRFSRVIKRFITSSILTMLPALIDLTKEEKKR